MTSPFFLGINKNRALVLSSSVPVPGVVSKIVIFDDDNIGASVKLVFLGNSTARSVSRIVAIAGADGALRLELGEHLRLPDRGYVGALGE